MTCLELMKKLRPDLSEDYIIDYFCPDTHELHMRKETPRFSFGCHSCVLSCYDCWNQEVDEEVLYFQDKIPAPKPKITTKFFTVDQLYEEWKSANEQIKELERENEILGKTDIHMLETANKKLREANEAMSDNFDSAMELVSKRDREIAELKDKVEYFKSARASLLEEYNRFMNDHRGLGKERDSFRRENEFFKEKIRELKQNNSRLNLEKNSLENNLGICRHANDTIKESFVKLQKKAKELGEENKDLRDTCLRLGKERDELDAKLKELKHICFEYLD